ncbi:MAG: MFS transporter [Bacteriovoracaceae bacterium]
MPNFVLAICMLLAALGTSIPNVALPTIMKFFDVTIPDVQLIILAHLLSSTISIIFIGRLGDLFGHRKVLLMGLVLYTTSALAAGFSTSLWSIVSLRAIQGLGSAALMAMSVAMVTNVVAKDKVGKAVGLLGTASAFGTASGPSVGGSILQFGWPAIFFLMSLVGLIVFFLVLAFLPKTNFKTNPQNFSFRGSKSLSLNLVMNAFVSMVMMSTLVVGPFYLNQTLGLSGTEVGLIMTVGPLVSILSGIPSGKIADRLGQLKIAKFGLLQLVLGALSFAILPQRFGVIGYIISAIVLSPGYQLFQAANTSMVILKAPDGLKGSVSGLLSFSRNVGLISGASIMSFVFHRFGMQITFFLAAGLAFLAVLIAFRLKKFS